jgi:hypothetical protein
MLQVPAPTASTEVNRLYESIRGDLEKWREALPPTAPNTERAERLGISGASEKRIGNLFRADKDEERARKAYETACEFYRRALDAEPFNHWVITQYLSMTAVLAPDDVADGLVVQYGALWSATRHIAELELRKATGEKQAWALATLAELELLGSMYAGKSFDPKKARTVIESFCCRIYDAVDRDAFPVFSTRRQFKRYLENWPRQEWKDLAAAGSAALGDGASWVGRAYQRSET